MSRAPRRPAIHVSAARGWLNDPNGLCHHGGVWHAYYQHVPDDDLPGAMCWGHATSADLVRWEEQPVALRPGPLGMVFSGSVVVDGDDTAGFGAGAMVAMYTNHSPEQECQSIAASTDGGRTWRPDDSNPVLVSDRPDFRDPKVWPLAEAGEARWAMCIGAGSDVEFYHSPDLRHWERTGQYTLPDDVDGTAECPDLLRFSGRTADVLVFSANPGDGGGACYAAVGDYDGSRFVAAGEPVRLDAGPDFYAAQSFHGVSGDPILLGWMGNWRTSTRQPSAGRRGALSFPRRIDLRSDRHDEHRVVQHFAVAPWARSPLDGQKHRSEPDRAFHVRLPPRAALELHGTSGLVVEVTTTDDTVQVWRDDPVDGEVALVAPMTAEGADVLIDHGTIEVAADDGATWITACYFAGAEWSLTVSGRGLVSEVRT